MSGTVVFTGPTLSAEEVRAVLPDADVRPPAALGDVHRAVLDRAEVVAVIDGYFERVPSLWHKELLWALDRGVIVLGGASMGALRAAELEPFGMVGVGRVFEWFHSGTIEDDDEVAVAHLGPDDGFRPVSDAMVNVRGTVERAVADGVVSGGRADEILAAAKRLHYTERRWPAILAGLDAPASSDVEAFRAWLTGGRVDVKGDDARALLRSIATGAHRERTPAPRDWRFEHTTFWELAVGELAEGRGDDDLPSTLSEAEQVLDELRLRPDELRDVTDEAFVRWLAAAYAQARSLELRPEETQMTLDELRLELGLFEPTDVERWLDDERMSIADLRTVVKGDAFVAWARATARRELPAIAIDVLRRRRRYGELRDVAAAKDRRLGSAWTHHGDAPGDTPTDDTSTDDAVLRWWFEEVEGRPVPVDLDADLAASGLGDRVGFVRAVRRERADRGIRT